MRPERRFATVGPQARVGPDTWEPALLAAGNVLAVTDAVLDGARRRTASRSSARRATTRPRASRWASACSTTSRSPPAMRSAATASSGSRSSTGTSTTATAPRRSSTTIPSVLFVSLHQDDLYPAGARRSRGDGGAGAGEGATVNVPLPAGTRRRRLRLRRSSGSSSRRSRTPSDPTCCSISAGQDPAASDPLGRMSVTAEGFRDLTERAMALAGELCDGRLVVVLEGRLQPRAAAVLQPRDRRAARRARAVVQRGPARARHPPRPARSRARRDRGHG